MKKKKPVSPTLNKMEVDEFTEFPLLRQAVVNSTIHRLKLESGKCFVQKRNKDKGVVIVIRKS